MHCSIYKGTRRPNTYVFVPAPDDFSAVSDALHATMGELIHVMDLVLYPGRRLARAEAGTVMRSLLTRGCWVQLPPEDEDMDLAPGTTME
jgi:uncharacterized protein YcgL (UPF0745 family)